MLDIENHRDLLAWLKEIGRIAPDESPACQTLAGGVSNRTVLLRRSSGEQWVLKQALPRLRTPIEWFADPARAQRESAGLDTLGALVPGRVPNLIFFSAAEHILAMTAIPQPHDNLKMLLLAGRIDADHIAQSAALLADIHSLSASRHHDFEVQFRDRSFFESLRLEPYYLFTATQRPEAADFLHDLVAATRRRTTALVHGDYSPKNMLIYDGRLILLDHEVIHFGDPAFDVGFFLAHLLSKARHLPDFRAQFLNASRQFWDLYANRRRVGEIESMSIRHTLACLLARVAGRSQLEYLSVSTRAAQRRDVVQLMHDVPASMNQLFTRFAACL